MYFPYFLHVRERWSHINTHTRTRTPGSSLQSFSQRNTVTLSIEILTPVYIINGGTVAEPRDI